MTAEIAIMNKSAVALAADSKVTIGSSGSKTFDTVNKVFTLSKVHPVGIMIFGNAEFMRYPWETVVKLYRAEKKAAKFRYVFEWADDFIRFVERFGSITIDDREQNIHSIVDSLFSELRSYVRRQAQLSNIRIGSPDFVNLLADYIDHVTNFHTGSRVLRAYPVNTYTYYML
jgi:hypothetical protein